MGTWAKRLTGLTILWLVPIVFYGLFRFVLVGLILPGHNLAQNMDQWFMGNIASLGLFFWLWIAVWSGISVGICIIAGYDGNYGSDDAVGTATSTLICVVLTVVGVTMTINIGVTNDKSYEQYYAKSVTFYVEDTQNLPQSLSRLVQKGQKSDASCAVISKASDVANCVKQGVLSSDGWDARVSSLDGSDYGLTHSASFKQHVNLNSGTLTYLNAWHGQSARWSGVLDGSGSSVPMGGVAEWDGHKVVQQCDFVGQYAIDRAFNGNKMNDMSDLLAEKYSSLHYNMSDVWGYCDGSQPIVIVPMLKQIAYGKRTVDTSAGFVIVQGDNGKTKLTYKTSATSNEYPGPVYPSSLVDTQRTASEWAAGRKNQDQNGFGFEPATSAAQAGNVSDYLLRDKVTGRLQWVTPLTLRGTSSEVFEAYAVSDADQTQSGTLNPLKIYVLSANDKRRINIDNMESDARNYLANQVPGFAGQSGKLVEFTPVGGNIWRAYGEINGRVEYLLDIDATDVSGSSKLINVGSSTSTSTTTASNAVCGKTLSGLTQSQLATCLKILADELATRQSGTTNTSK